jgi:hypothetical protein
MERNVSAERAPSSVAALAKGVQWGLTPLKKMQMESDPI